MKRLFSVKTTAIIVIAAILTGLLFFWNFYPQSGIVPNMYSDTASHAIWSYNMVEQGDYPSKVNSYPLFFFITGLFGKAFNNIYFGISFVAALIGILTFFAQLYFFSKTTIQSKYLIIILSFVLTFVWPIILNPSLMTDADYLLQVYCKSWSATPAHNLTSLAVKPISILIISIYLEIIKEEKYVKRLVILSILLLLSVLIKPSFYQYFAIAVTIYTICYFILKSDKKSFVKSLCIALSLVPATLWVLYGMIFNINGMEFYPFRSLVLNYNKDAWLCFSSLLRGVIFCVVAFIYLFIKKAISKDMWFVYLCITIAFAEFVLFIEPAEETSFNLAWGYMNAVYIVFIYSAKEICCFIPKTFTDKIMKTLCCVLLCLHSLTGISAYINFANGYRNEYKDPNNGSTTSRSRETLEYIDRTNVKK